MDVRPFISYAREDRETALQLYGDLRQNGARPWIDVEHIGGGEEWKPAIARAISEASHFIALISDRSVNKQGFVQNELRQAIDVLETFPPGEIFLIPVRLDGSEPRHSRLAELHWIDLFPDYREGFRKLLRSLRLEAAAPEPVEYQSHEPASRQAPQIPAGAAARDDEGFLTSTAVGDLVLARVQGRQRLRTHPILLFENSYQHTWLVVTERVVACVLDDIEKPSAYNPLRWQCRHRFALPVEVEPYKKTVGLIHLGPEHRDWLYSIRLHPDPKRIQREIETLLRP